MSVTTPIFAFDQSVGAVCVPPDLKLAHGSGGADGAALPPPAGVLEQAARTRTIELNRTAPRRRTRMLPPLHRVARAGLSSLAARWWCAPAAARGRSAPHRSDCRVSRARIRAGLGDRG